MNNKFSIFDWLFGTPKNNEIKKENKKEKHHEEVVIDPVDNIVHENESISSTIVEEMPTCSFTKEKKEVKETKNEEELSAYIEERKIDNTTNIINIQNNVLMQIEIMLKNEQYEINKIKYEFELLKEQEDETNSLEKANKLIAQLNDLIKRFEKLKKDFYQKNYDKINIGRIDDAYINSLIEEYKTALKNNNIENIGLLQIEKIEEYIEIIDSIVSIENDTDELNDTLENKKEELETTDKDIDEKESNCNSIKKTNDYVEKYIKEQATIIKDIKKKVESSSKITKIAEYKTELSIKYGMLLTSTLLMASTLSIPPTRKGNLLKIGLIVASVAGMSQVARISTKEKKVTTKVDFVDYEKNIKSNIENVNDMDKLINGSIKDIKDLKKCLKKDLSKYKNLVPQYVDLISKLDSIEKELITKSKIAIEYDEKLKDSLHKNNIKVKKLEEEYKC